MGANTDFWYLPAALTMLINFGSCPI